MLPSNRCIPLSYLQPLYQYMECPICMQKFNTNTRTPYDVCINKHTYCKVCVDKLLDDQQQPKCPQCRVLINRRLVSVNRAANAILEEVIGEQSSHVNMNVRKGSSTQVETVMPVVRFLWLKVLILGLLSWGVELITWVYVFQKDGYFRLFFIYPILFKFYQLLKNRDLYEKGSPALLLKMGLFPLMQEIQPGQKFYYLQFAVRWLTTVCGIIAIESVYQPHWSDLSIAALIFNILSIILLLASRVQLKKILNVIENQYQWIPIFCLIILMLLSLITSFTNIILLIQHCYPLAIVFCLGWIATTIYSTVAQKGSGCCSIATMLFVLILSFAFSIGMFCWISIKHKLNRWPSTLMVILRLVICPLVVFGLLVAGKINSEVAVAAQLLSVSQIALSIYLNSR